MVIAVVAKHYGRGNIINSCKQTNKLTSYIWIIFVFSTVDKPKIYEKSILALYWKAVALEYQVALAQKNSSMENKAFVQ